MYSMTAFATGSEDTPWGHLTLELRSLNHRYLELFIRLPEELRGLEPGFRETLGEQLGRGKVDLSLRFRRGANDTKASMQLNQALLSNLAELAAQTRSVVTDTPRASDLDYLRWPGVVQDPDPDLGALAAAAQALLERVLGDLRTMRQREGQRLAETLDERLRQVRPIVESVRETLPEIRQRLADRLHEKVEQLTQQLDSDRLEQEVALLLQRMDVDEELDRLTGHVAEVERQLKASKPVGRRLDFLMQELHREANTLGAKSIDQRTTQWSVDLKVLIEQMREQVQNIE
ncbi:MAG: YicC/YloC family endoribonuclease [Pseudomonadota bacterium]